MSSSPIIRLEGLEKTYDLGAIQVHALRGVSLDIAAGSYVAIMGPSGSGKSTMLNMLGCLDRPSAGAYYLGGDDVSKMDDDELSTVRGKRLGFIFQSYNLINQLSVIENIYVPLFYQGRDLNECYDHCEKLAKLATGTEILNLLDKLNAEGKTIVLVTHGEEVAERAHRVLHMKDGVIDHEIHQRTLQHVVEALEHDSVEEPPAP
ncbi:MAG: ATP-binding cassette domain-containing protein [Verrucomicrobia bacterium]|nr:ATP-binding cassette domain-containing protein [Verrucomicrobiota bacterium]